jgi:hypothetical protein
MATCAEGSVNNEFPRSPQAVEKLPVAYFWPSIGLQKRLFGGSKAQFGTPDEPSIEFFNKLESSRAVTH